MSYKHRNGGETPPHQPNIAPADNTRVVNASGPNADSSGDRLQASRHKKIGEHLEDQSYNEPNTLGGALNSSWKDMLARTRFAQAKKSTEKADAADLVKSKALRTAGLSDPDLDATKEQDAADYISSTAKKK